jgi:hypothetical protein
MLETVISGSFKNHITYLFMTPATSNENLSYVYNFCRWHSYTVNYHVMHVAKKVSHV